MTTSRKRSYCERYSAAHMHDDYSKLHSDELARVAHGCSIAIAYAARDLRRYVRQARKVIREMARRLQDHENRKEPTP